jgi:two-component system nitrogen regulation response regulator NtrX
LQTQSKRILIVEDNEALLSSLVDLLESEGYAVDTVKTGHEAIEKMAAQVYHLMLIDIQLPDMEGTRLLETPSKEQIRTVKIILTGHPSMEKAAGALFQGADAYLMKPVSPEELLKLVSSKLATQNQRIEKQPPKRTRRGAQKKTSR